MVPVMNIFTKIQFSKVENILFQNFVVYLPVCEEKPVCKKNNNPICSNLVTTKSAFQVFDFKAYNGVLYNNPLRLVLLNKVQNKICSK